MDNNSKGSKLHIKPNATDVDCANIFFLFRQIFHFQTAPLGAQLLAVRHCVMSQRRKTLGHGRGRGQGH